MIKHIENKYFDVKPNVNPSKILKQIVKNKVDTYQTDGREKIEVLYQKYLDLHLSQNWEIVKITDSKTEWQGKEISFPILAFQTKIKGPAVYIISGIHGEEPTGPNAIAKSIKQLDEIGQKKPMVILPMCNPLGYFRNWRYLNKEKYTDSPKITGKSVGDSDHLLLDPKKTTPRIEKPTSLESLALSNYILQISQTYPPAISFDFHGDILIPKGYIYSQGKDGKNDKLAPQILKILEDNEIPIQWDGRTRFEEEIINGIVGQQADGSIDELISTDKIIVNGKIISGPNANQVFVLETPDANIPLTKRVNAYQAVISLLKNL